MAQRRRVVQPRRDATSAPVKYATDSTDYYKKTKHKENASSACDLGQKGSSTSQRMNAEAPGPNGDGHTVNSVTSSHEHSFSQPNYSVSSQSGGDGQSCDAALRNSSSSKTDNDTTATAFNDNFAHGGTSTAHVTPAPHESACQAASAVDATQVNRSEVKVHSVSTSRGVVKSATAAAATAETSQTNATEMCSDKQCHAIDVQENVQNQTAELCKELKTAENDAPASKSNNNSTVITQQVPTNQNQLTTTAVNQSDSTTATGASVKQPTQENLQQSKTENCRLWTCIVFWAVAVNFLFFG